jgi:hypothetical protein
MRGNRGVSEEINIARGNGATPSVDPFANLDTDRLADGTTRPSSIFDDLEALRIDLDDDDDVGQEVLSTVPVRRPGKQWFRCYPSAEYRFTAYILEDPLAKTTRYVVPEVGNALAPDTEIKKVILTLCINRRNVMFLWPVTTHGRWRDAALKAAEQARSQWVKAIGDTDLGAYRITEPKEGRDFGEPVWPEPMPSMKELLSLAFGGSGGIVDSLEHPAVREL